MKKIKKKNNKKNLCFVNFILYYFKFYYFCTFYFNFTSSPYLLFYAFSFAKKKKKILFKSIKNENCIILDLVCVLLVFDFIF